MVVFFLARTSYSFTVGMMSLVVYDLKKEAVAGDSCDRLSFLRRYFCHLFGYSQTGCFPAEPVSASPSFALRILQNILRGYGSTSRKILLYGDYIFLRSPVRLHEHTVDLIEIDGLRMVSDCFDESRYA